MKYELIAVYREKEYPAFISKEGKIGLRSTDVTDVINGFTPIKFVENTYVKYVLRSEIDRLFKRYTKAEYRGYIFEVDGEDDGQLSLYSLIDDYRINETLGFQCVDRGVYQKWVKRQDVKITIEEEEYNL